MATQKTKAAKSLAISKQEQAKHTAIATLMPSANAAAVIEAYGIGTFGEQDINLLIIELREQFGKVKENDLHHCESMLVGQANALQSIFVNLARRATNQEYVKNYETFLRLALKAQNQSRMTLETLATIKNPPIVYAKQANINQGSGNQQVNNGTPEPVTRAEKTVNQPNELLEVQHGSETMDSRATSATGRKNKAMATVG